MKCVFYKEKRFCRGRKLCGQNIGISKGCGVWQQITTGLTIYFPTLACLFSKNTSKRYHNLICDRGLKKNFTPTKVPIIGNFNKSSCHFFTLSRTNPPTLHPERYYDHLCHFYIGVPPWAIPILNCIKRNNGKRNKTDLELQEEWLSI